MQGIHAYSCHGAEQFHDEMVRGTIAAVAIRELAGFLLGKRYHLFYVLRRQIAIGDDHLRHEVVKVIGVKAFTASYGSFEYARD